MENAGDEHKVAVSGHAGHSTSEEQKWTQLGMSPFFFQDSSQCHCEGPSPVLVAKREHLRLK